MSTVLILNKIGPYYTSYAVFITSQVEKRETKASLKQATVLLIAWQITFGSTARKSSTLFGKCVSLPLAQRRSLRTTFFRRRGRSPGLDEERERLWLRKMFEAEAVLSYCQRC